MAAPPSHARLSRRDILALGAAVSLGLVRRAPAAPVRLVWHRLPRGGWMIEHGGGNTTVLAERGKVVVVDVKMPAVGGVLAEEIVRRVGPIDTVILTHHHGDHAGGLLAFAGRPAYAQTKAAARIRADTTRLMARVAADAEGVTRNILKSLATDFGVPTTAAATKLVEGYVGTIAGADAGRFQPTAAVEDRGTPAGVEAVELIHTGPGHTDNDIFVHHAGRDLLIAGDLLFERHHPFLDVDAGATSAGWQRALTEAIARCGPRTTVVSGHGRVVGRAALAAQSAYFDQLRDLVGAARAAGRSREEIVTTPPGAFGSYGFLDGWPENLGKIFDELARG